MQAGWICVGHRGAMGYEPENTLRSVERALQLGADWIEIDIHLAGEHLVVLHDTTLDRTTNGTGLVRDQSLDYLRSLDAGKGERIPLLAEVFEAVNRRGGMLIEIKSPGCAEATAKLIQDQINRGWAYEEIQVSSFNHREVKHIKQVNPKINTGVFYYGLPVDAGFAEQLGVSYLSVSQVFLDQELVADAHGRGLKVLSFVVNQPPDILRIAGMGVDGLITDYPDRVLGHIAR